MNERLSNWHPTQAEVKDIVRELRPMIHEMARRQQQQIRRQPATAVHAARVPATVGA